MTGYLADTSVFVAAENGRVLGEPPAGRARISVATLTELKLGALAAKDVPARKLREGTLLRATSFLALPYGEEVADELAKLLHLARSNRRRAGAEDAIIAATALTHGLTVWTQDADFEVLAELEPRLRVQVG